MRGVTGIAVVGWLLVSGPAAAGGKHIACVFESSGPPREMAFYLDDAREQLVAENRGTGEPINVRTTLYSDTRIEAEMSTGMVPNAMFFDRVLRAPAKLIIDRVSGVSAYTATFLPDGAEAGAGDCSEVSPPATKF